MPQSASPSIVTIRLATAGRLLLLLPILLALTGGWFVLRWYLGNTISEVVSANESPNMDLARTAVSWAPADPFVHWRLGVLTQREFSADRLQEARREFEAAVRLAPNDFRFWDELGRACEMSGDAEAAGRAFRRAVELAPSYHYPRWHLGNFLLRQGDSGEAFQELIRAATANDQLWPQVFGLAWQAFDGDVDQAAKVTCHSPSACVMFAQYLIGLKKTDDAVRLWKSISPVDRRQLGTLGQEFRKSLWDAKRFQSALEVMREIEADAGELPVPDQFLNGGFENNLTIPAFQSFGWVISSGPQVNISISNGAHNGKNSLRIVFTAPNNLPGINLSQTIAVTPNTQYLFECYVRTDELSSASTPVVLVLDAADNATLATSAPLPTGTNDWQKIVVDFKTRNSDGITITLSRSPCTVGDLCPIFGNVWYDDFNLQRAGSPRTSPPAGTRD